MRRVESRGPLAPRTIEARGDEHRARQHDLAGHDATRAFGARVVGVDRHAARDRLDVDDELAETDAVGHRLRQPAGQPAIALRPREHDVAVLGIDVARGVVMDAGPRGGVGEVAAEVVATAVLDPPAQARRRVAARGEEVGHRDAVQLGEGAGCPRPARHGEPATAGAVPPATIAVHLQPEALELGAVVGVGAGRREQPFVPATEEEQSLLRSVTQVLLVVDRPAGAIHALDDADLAQQRAYSVRGRARQRQVVRAPGIAGHGRGARPRVAAGRVLQLEHDEIAQAGARELPGRRQSGDPAADDGHGDPLRP